MQIIETRVYTYDELDEKAQERAREWYLSADDDFLESVADTLMMALQGAYGPDARIDGWDYYRSHVAVGGKLLRPDVNESENAGFRDWKLDGVPLEVTEEWPAPEHDVLDLDNYYLPEANDYLAAVESVLVRLMNAEGDHLTSEEYVSETIIANGYTFTAVGRWFG